MIFTLAIENLDKKYLLQLGFDEALNIGDYLMPSVLGEFTHFNVNGRMIVRYTHHLKGND